MFMFIHDVNGLGLKIFSPPHMSYTNQALPIEQGTGQKNVTMVPFQDQGVVLIMRFSLLA
ncbi:hypothetical protein SAMN05216332_101282 [Nitrosospira briensis]|nr:hypothetical protein SAMN05216332_101282 [Nitrosospira briensis]